jgi:N-acetylneuraminate synthase
MSYINYRHMVELGYDEYAVIDAYCREKGIDWFVSCWDEVAVDFMEQFNPGVYKFASASLTDHALIEKVKQTGKPYILSTGMSTMDEIREAVDKFGTDNLLIAHSTSAYPCPPQELNLRMIETLADLFPDTPIGYSGHETGLATTVAAVAMGACFVERHFTLDRAMWGSDHAASVEPQGMHKLVRDIRDVEQSLGDGIKRVYESELGPMKRLRRARTTTAAI